MSARRLQQRSRTLIFSSCLLAAVDCSVLYERENASDVDDPLRIHVMCPEQRHAGKERAVCGDCVSAVDVFVDIFIISFVFRLSKFFWVMK